jgi:hypothetical protein
VRPRSVNQIGQHSRGAATRIAGLVVDLRGNDPMGTGESWGPGGRLGAGTLQLTTGVGMTPEQWALASAAHRMAVLP